MNDMLSSFGKVIGTVAGLFVSYLAVNKYATVKFNQKVDAEIKRREGKKENSNV
jgi:hypothetical protein